MATVKITRRRSGPRAGRPLDARPKPAELYDVASWGKGYFSVGNERAPVGASRQGPEPRPRSEGTGRQSPASRHRAADPDPLRRNSASTGWAKCTRRFKTPSPSTATKSTYCCVYPIKVNQQRQVVEEVFEYGRPVQFRPGSRLEAGAAGGAGHRRQRHADHLQRLQGRRVHRDGDAGQEDRPADHSGGREIHRAGPDPETFRARRRAAGDRAAHQAGQPRLGALEIVGRVPLEVRADGHRRAARAGTAEGAADGGLPPASAFPSGQPDHQYPPDQGRGDGSGARVRGAEARRRGPAPTWTSAAGWASITTARRRISNRASITRCRNTPTTWCITSRACATKPRCRIRSIVSESGRAIAAYHSVLVFNVLGVTGFGDSESMPEIPEDVEQPLIDLKETLRGLTQQEPAGEFSRRAAGARFGAEPVQPGLSAAAAAQLGGEHLLADLPAHSEAGQGAGLFSGGAGGPGRPALRHLFLQFFAVPKHAGQLGGEAAVPDHADSPAGGGAVPARHSGRHLLRFRRQSGSVHRPPRREEDAAAAHLQRRAVLFWARFWWARIRKSWAICTICSATPTPCTSAWTKKARWCWKR